MQSFAQYRGFGHTVRTQLVKQHTRPVGYVERSYFPARHHPTTSSIYSARNAEIDRNNNTASVQTQSSIHRASDHHLAGIHLRPQTTTEGGGGQGRVVTWDGEDDPHNPRNWSVIYRIFITIIVASISFVVGAASSVDAAILPQAAADLKGSEVVESLIIGIYPFFLSFSFLDRY